MNNNILPSYDKTVYETLFWMRRELPFVFHRDTLHSDGKPCIPTLHVNLELIHILEGTATVTFNGEPVNMKPGDLAIFNSYVAHTVLPTDTVTFDCVLVDNDFLADNGIDLSRLEFPSVVHDPKVSELLSEFFRASNARNSSYMSLELKYEDSKDIHFRNATLRSIFLQLMLHLAKTYSKEKEHDILNGGVMSRIWMSIEFMKKHINQKIPLEQLAATAGFSKYYFLRVFKEYTGYTPNTYLTLLRCDRAKRLLQTGNYTVRETAKLCGYENFSYFSKVFKEHTGQSPYTVLKKVSNA